MKLEDFSVRMAGKTLEVSGDPAVLSDVCNILTTAVELTRYLKKRSEHLQAELRSQATHDQVRRTADFHQRSKEVYGHFLRHLNNGCAGDRKAALKAMRQDLGLLACDARIFVAKGRELAGH